MMRIPRLAKFLIILVTLVVALQSVTLAKTPYQDYNFFLDEYDMAAAPGYLPIEVIDGNTLKTDKFKNVTDIFEKDGLFYVLDSGNNRVVVMNKDLSLKEIIKITKDNGEEVVLGAEKDKGGQGIFIDNNGRMFISVRDRDASISSDKNGNPAGCVYVTDMSGKVIKTITHPQSDVIPDGTTFEPINTVVDKSGMIYICSKGTTRGTYQFNDKFEFVGFFGSQNIQITPELVLEMFWRKILSQDIKDAGPRIVPTPFANFDIGLDDFIYTVAPGSVSSDQVLKLNATSKNVLKIKGTKFGDVKDYWDPQNADIKSDLLDISIDEKGFIYVLDNTRGRVFVYDQEYGLITIFGGKNTSSDQRQMGTFHTPSAIETVGDKVFVVDEFNNNITVFKQTDAVASMKQGLTLLKDGQYEEAGPYWEDVLKYDSFNMIGNMGMGKYHYAMRNYDKSLEYSKRCFDYRAYEMTFKEVRDENMNKYFPFIILGVLILIFAPIIISKIREKNRPDEYTVKRNKYQYPFFCMFHPFKGYSDMKYEKKGSLMLANMIIIALLAVNILTKTAVGFLWDPSVAEILFFNLTATIFTTIGGFALWIICNWAITTLFDGEGKFTEIWIFSAYAFLPMVILSIPIIIMSNFLTGDELAFLEIFFYFMQGWFALSMIMATKEVHQYTMKKTIFAILATLLTMLLVICIFAIIYSMFTRLISFGTDIYNELLLRF